MGIVGVEKSHRQAENENEILHGSISCLYDKIFLKDFEDSNSSIAEAGPAFPVFPRIRFCAGKGEWQLTASWINGQDERQT